MDYYIVDAFSEKPYTGNPAAVCLLTRPVEDKLLQNFAAMLNLSETAYLIKNDHSYNLRWFTPTTEIELCGHATLASSHILWETGELGESEEARFDTISGLLVARKSNDQIHMDFPAEGVSVSESPEDLSSALDVKPIFTGKNRFDYLLEVESEESVKGISPDFELLKSIDCRGVIVTSRSKSKNYDFVSRFFAPRVGVNEDPVTGSAHCALGPYWSEKTGKSELTGYQASDRGGIVHVITEGKKVVLGGKAVTVKSGEFIV